MTNKEKARAYYQAVNQYDEAMVEKLVDENYIQHNPYVPTGRSAFVSLLPKLKQHGSKIENIRMLQDGPFIVMHHQWRNAIPLGKEEMAAFHVIRFDEAGLIAEHWNVTAETTPPNPSGRTLIDGAATIEDREETETNRSLVVELFRHWTGRDAADPLKIFPRYFHAGYHQHHSRVNDGIAGYREAVRTGTLAIEYRHQHKVLAEGNFVLSISEGIHGNNPAACYDLFRLKDGKIAEHWNIYQDIPKGPVANENTMFAFY